VVQVALVPEPSAGVQETSAAFVTLHQRQLQSVVAIGLMSYNENLWKTSPAPSPEEVIWRNVQARTSRCCLALLAVS
jgi:Cytosolic domain of 10TM putative phosphate transporter